MSNPEHDLGPESSHGRRLDEVCCGFEGAWKAVLGQGGPPPRIEDFLPHPEDGKSVAGASDQQPVEDSALLVNLVMTDLEYRWRRRGGTDLRVSEDGTAPLDAQSPALSSTLPNRPLLEHYVARYPVLGPVQQLPLDLIEDEFRIRHLYGDRPQPDEYVARFGAWHPEIAERLASILSKLEPRPPAQAPQNPAETPTTGDYRTADVRPGTRIRYLGDYEVLELIGCGGMGKVYKARQISLNRLVAVKTIRTDELPSENDVRRFQAEAKAAAGLDHPSIVPVYEVGQHEGEHYFSMGYVEGQSLSHRIAESPLPPREAARIMAQVAEAVEYAHGQKVIHRDLKPSNILLDRSGQPRVTDFGLAKRLDQDSDLTRTGTPIGTPSYMPPEQASGQGKQIGVLSDVYSLGATLYATLTGRPPFQADNPFDTCQQVIQQEPIPLRQLNPKLPRDLETICLKCLEKDPRRRYASAQEFADELGRYMRGEPIHARPVSRSERLWRWCRRNQAVAALIAAVAVTLIAGTIVSSAFAVIANRQRDRAEAGEKLATDRLVQVKAERQRVEEQRERAEEERKKAEEERRIAQAVKDFLQTKLLGQADVRMQANERLRLGGSSTEAKLNLTIRELLDRAAAELAPETIEASFPGQLLLQAEILRTVGDTYRGVGECQRSIGFLDRATVLYRAQRGSDHPDTLTTMNNLASAYEYAGKLDLALPLFKKALKLTKEKFGANHPSTLVSMNNLAFAYGYGGRVDLALPLLDETLERMKANLGPDHPDTLTCMGNLAVAYRSAGKLDRALQLCKKTLELTKAKFGPDHPSTLMNMNCLASIYQDVGRLDLARPLCEETLNRMKTKLGLDHPDTLTCMTNLACVYQSAGKPDLALPLCEETLKLSKAKLGPDHPDTLKSMSNLVVAYESAGKLDLARPLCEGTLNRMKTKLGPDHPDTLTCMTNLACVYQSAGKPDLALPLCEETLKLSKAKLGPDHPDTLKSMSNLARAYQVVGKLDRAVLLFEETLKLRKVKLGPDHPDTLRTMSSLASAYEFAGKVDLALPLCKETLELTEKKLGPDHPDTLASMNCLGMAYQIAGKLDQATPLLEETLKIRKAKLGPDHPDTLRSMGSLAWTYRAAGKLGPALPLFEETLRLMKAKLGPDHPDTLATANNLALSYHDARKPDLVLPLCEETLKLMKVKLGADHRDTLMCMNSLAVAYWKVGRLDSSIPLFEEMLRLQEARLGRQHSDTLRTVANLGINYKDGGRVAEALPVLEEAHRAARKYPSLRWVRDPLLDCYARAGKSQEAVALAKEMLAESQRQLPKESPQLAQRLTSIALPLLRANAFPEAESLLRECLAIREKTEPEGWVTFNAKSMLGGALLGQKKYAAAEPLLLAGYEGMRQREAKILPKDRVCVNEALERLIQLAKALGKKQDEAKWQRELETRKKSVR
jgi:eukaryotic-like serine/threonine-protein kinase